MRGLLADANNRGQVDYLIGRMQSNEWIDFWRYLGLSARHFEDFGLSVAASDLEVWRLCQAEQLVLITDNRNQDSADSMEATIRLHSTATSLPVFTIGNISEFAKRREYAERVVSSLYDYLLRIDTVRGTGRIFLP